LTDNLQRGAIGLSSTEEEVAEEARQEEVNLHPGKLIEGT
jgi:hypothetical protein